MPTTQYTLNSNTSRIDFHFDDAVNKFYLSSVSSIDGSQQLFEPINIFSFKYQKNNDAPVYYNSVNNPSNVSHTENYLSIAFMFDDALNQVRRYVNIIVSAQDDGFFLSSNVRAVLNMGGDLDIISGLKYEFPIFRIKSDLGGSLPGYNDVFITPFDGGKAQQWPSFGQGADYDPFGTGAYEYAIGPGQNCPYQMCYYYNLSSNNGLYFQTLDLSGYLKEFRSKGFHYLKDSVSIPCTEVRLDNHITVSGNSQEYFYGMPYKFFIKSMVGDWYDAALRYRQFSEATPWVSRGKIGNTSDDEMSSIIKKKSLIFFQKPKLEKTSDGFFEANLDRFYVDANILLNRIDVPFNKVASLMLGWNTSAFDDGYPYFTPQSDFSGTTGIVSKYKARGTEVIPYVNPVGIEQAFTNSDPFYNYKVIESDGTTVEINETEYLNIRNPEITDLILGANNVGGIYSSIANTGIGGMLFDVVVGGGSWNDYNPSLNDNGGVGNTGLDVPAIKNFLSRARSKFNASNPGFVMMSEGLSENILDSIDLVQRPLSVIGVGGTAITYLVGASLYTSKIGMWESIYGDYMFTMDRLMTVNPEAYYYFSFLNYTFNSNFNGTQTGLTVEPSVSSIPANNPYGFNIFFSHYVHLGMIPTLGNSYSTPNAGADEHATHNAPYSLTTDNGYPGQPHEKMFDFAKVILAQSEYYKIYSTWGRRMRPLNPNQEIIDYRYKNNPVATSIWEAHDGTLGVIVTNAGNSEKQVDIQMNHSSYGLSRFNTISEITNGGAVFVNNIVGGLAGFSIIAPPFSLRIFKFHNRSIGTDTQRKKTITESFTTRIGIKEALNI